MSAFGGIVAVNRDGDRGDWPKRSARCSPRWSWHRGSRPAPLATLTARRNLRVLEAPRPAPWRLDVRPVDGGLLVQTPDPVDVDPPAWSVVTARAPEPTSNGDDLAFAWTVCAAVSSNAIVLATDGQAVGIGAGQQNRVDSARIAAARAGVGLPARCAASDAFFPFRDGIDVLADGRRGGDRPAGRQRPRRRGDRRRRRAGHRHGVHRRAPLPPLIAFPGHAGDGRALASAPAPTRSIAGRSLLTHASGWPSLGRPLGRLGPWHGSPTCWPAAAPSRSSSSRLATMPCSSPSDARSPSSNRSSRASCRSPTAPAARAASGRATSSRGCARETAITPMAHLTCQGHSSRRDHRVARRVPRRRHREHHGPRR